MSDNNINPNININSIKETARKEMAEGATDVAAAILMLERRLAMLDSDGVFQEHGHGEYKALYRMALERALKPLEEAECRYLRQRAYQRAARQEDPVGHFIISGMVDLVNETFLANLATKLDWDTSRLSSERERVEAARIEQDSKYGAF